MRILVLGGTGLIGGAVLRALVARGHEVLTLVRSPRSAAIVAGAGAVAVAGDIREPACWTEGLSDLDGVIHAAAGFEADMGAVDTRLLERLLPALGRMAGRPRFVYTGGCWLYGETGPAEAVEDTPFDPLPAFAWMVPNLARVLGAREVVGLVVHPALVCGPGGGVLAGMIADASAGRAVTIVGGTGVRWPLVHADDLAELYVHVLERGAPGRSYNGAALSGVAVGTIAAAVARHFGHARTSPAAVSADAAAARLGEWARGYALDQRMSGARARRELGWRIVHRDPVATVLAGLPAGPL